MCNVGLTEVGPWQWTHEKAGDISFRPADLNAFESPNCLLQHRLREAWRFSNFALWQNSDRHDANACGDAAVTADQFPALKKLPVEDKHALASLTKPFREPHGLSKDV